MAGRKRMILVCGGRDYADKERLYSVMDSVLAKYPDMVLVQGSALGADLMAESWAKDRQIDYMGFPAKWDKQGKGAGPIRNKRMRDETKPFAAVAFPGGGGTAGMVRLLKEIGVPVMEVK